MKNPSSIPVLILFLVLVMPISAQNFGSRVRPFIETEANVIAFTNAIVIDGSGIPAQEGRTILVRNGLIESVGDAEKVVIPAAAQIFDLTGKTLLPGFVMMHEHMYYPAPGPDMYHVNQMDYSFPKLYLAGGATTIRTGGSVEPYSDLNLKKWIDQGAILGPKMDITAPYINGYAGVGIASMKAISGPEDAMEMVNYWADEGFTSFKVYENINREALQAVVDQAHGRGLKVTGHICSVTFREAAGIGIDNLEHGFIMASDFASEKQADLCPSAGRQSSILALDVNAPEMEALFSYLVEKNVAVTSTLPVFETFAKGRPVASRRVLDAMNPTMREMYLTTWAAVNSADDQSGAVQLEKEMQWEKAFVEAGGHLMVGTDPTGYGGVVAGFSNIRAVELLVEAGFSLEGAIKIATWNGAQYLGLEKEIGSISVGKKADLVVINGDPTQNIKQLRNVELVFKDGVGFNSEKIFEATKGKVGVH